MPLSALTPSRSLHPMAHRCAGDVKAVMEHTKMLSNAAALCAVARKKGTIDGAPPAAMCLIFVFEIFLSCSLIVV